MSNPIDHFRYVGKKNVNQNCRNQLFLNRLPRISDDLNQTFEDMINMSVSSSNSLGVSFVSGAIAGSAASFVTMPFYVIKTIKQIEREEVKPGTADITRHSNMFIAFINLRPNQKQPDNSQGSDERTWCPWLVFWGGPKTAQGWACLCCHHLQLWVLQGVLQTTKQTDGTTILTN